MEAKAFRHQAQTNHQQEAQTQHHHRRMLVHETRQRFRRQQHDRHRNNHSRHHDRQMVHHADRRDHRIQREDRIQHHDLQHHYPEAGIAFTVTIIVLPVFQPLMELCRRFEEQEYPPDQHDQITAGEGVIHDGEQRFGQRDHPRDNGEQTQSHDQRQRETNQTRFITLFWRQLIRKDGDKHQVIDAENNLQHHQREQSYPD